MQLQISFHGLAHSDALAQAIAEAAQGLERFYGHLIRCRVVVELASRSRQQGNAYVVRIVLDVPGVELAVTHEHDLDPHVALREAFHAARRRLEDYVRIRRGEVKSHRLA